MGCSCSTNKTSSGHGSKMNNLDDNYKLTVQKVKWSNKVQLKPSQNSKIYGLVLNNIVDKLSNIKIKDGEVYSDKEFPASYSSIKDSDGICAKNDDPPKQSDITWKRPKEFLGTSTPIVVFDDQIEPNDIHQGSLGDCYFLSALQSLASYPYLIKRLFESPDYNEKGIYCVFLNFDGTWKQVIIDDKFPCGSISNKPCFAQGTGSELWTLLLEKAYSKLFKSYWRIVSGLPYKAIQDLTGAPYDRMEIKSEKNPLNIWNFLKEGNSKQHFLTASTYSKEFVGEKENENGIVSNHAYSILEVKEVDTGYGQRVKLVKIRNPWGRFEWKGDWSDTSLKWTDDLKVQLRQVNNDDGIFWMSFEDLLENYESVSVTKVQQYYYYSSVKLHQTKDLFAKFFKFTVPLNGSRKIIHAYIQGHQMDERQFDTSENYEYSRAEIRLFKGTDFKSVEKEVGMKNFTERNGYFEVALEAGASYIGVIRVDWKKLATYETVVSVYAAQPIEIYEVLLTNSQIMNNAIPAILKVLGPSENYKEIKCEHHDDIF